MVGLGGGCQLPGPACAPGYPEACPVLPGLIGPSLGSPSLALCSQVELGSISSQGKGLQGMGASGGAYWRTQEGGGCVCAQTGPDFSRLLYWALSGPWWHCLPKGRCLHTLPLPLLGPPSGRDDAHGDSRCSFAQICQWGLNVHSVVIAV